MDRKQRFIAWGIYSVVSFLLLLIAFDLKVSISLSIIIGFVCGILNQIVHLLRKSN